MLPRPIDEMEQEARRDDWHTLFVGSDIRQLIGEIKRLEGELAAILLERDGHRGYGETVRHLREENDGLREELHLVADLIDDVLYDPCWHPVNRAGETIRGDDLYLMDHPIQDLHTPALRNWFVEFHKKLSAAALTPPAGTEGGAE